VNDRIQVISFLNTAFTSIPIFNLLFVGVLVELCHDHEIDGAFHYDCPACRYENQSVANDPREIAGSTQSSFSLPGVGIYIPIQPVIRGQIVPTSHQSRAPPLSMQIFQQV
jgi:hypothetical protein